jgi:hypothetical protein
MKSFIIHKDSLLILDELTDEQAGKLFKAIANYQNGIETNLDFGLRMAFAPFKNQFVRDLEKYNEKCERNKSNGNKGGRPKKDIENTETQTNPKNPVGYFETEKTQTNPKNPNEPYNKSNNNSNNNIYIENQNLTDTEKQLETFNNILNADEKLKQDFENLPKPLNIDTEYYNAFLEKWNLYGSKYKDRKVKLSSLQQFDKQNLKTINKSIEEISKALFILFNQNNIIESCLVTPKHFLLDFQKYYQAGLEYEKSKNLIQFYKPKN